jgi:ferredoxin
MKVTVDAERCQGHGRCYAQSPHFQIEDFDGHAYVDDEHVPPDLETSVRMAARGCPERAIVVVDDHDQVAR